MSRTPSRLDAVAVLALAPVLAALSPHPLDAVRALSATGDPTAPLLAAVALAAWTCTLWLSLLLAVGLGGHLPGVVGGAARAVLRRLAPASVRAVVCAATGLTLAGSVLLGPAASAADRVPVPLSTSLDWPTAVTNPSAVPTTVTTAAPTSARISAPATSPNPTPERATPLPTRPTAPPPTAPALTAPAFTAPTPTAAPSATAAPITPPEPAPTAEAVIVRPGDSLWALTARDLGPRATGAQVAQAWPTWWSANRTVIGDDPDLILPGTSLNRPYAAPTR